jgi:hypothetical protein
MFGSLGGRPSRATLLASAALVMSACAVLFALSTSASAGSRVSGPYVSNLTVHDEPGKTFDLGAGQVGQQEVYCPEGEVLISGGYHASGTIGKLSNVVSLTSSYPKNLIKYVFSSNGTKTDEFGPRYWAITAVNPSLAHSVSVTPYAMCLQVEVTVTAHA